MVVTSRPATASSGVTQERTAWPSRCTVQAPHSALPQPNLVPTSFISPRSTHSSGVSGSALTVAVRPLIFSVVVVVVMGVFPVRGDQASRSGRLRRRWPVNANTALATAGAMGGVPGSPTPPGGTSAPVPARMSTSMAGHSSMRSGV
ncbi:hypothetical protein D9M69_637470 [compost metagenome]